MKPVTKRILIASVVSLGAIAGTVVVVRMKNKKDQDKRDAEDAAIHEQQQKEISANNGTGTVITKIPSDPFPLKLGSRGKNVLNLQSALAAKGENVTVDGKFGTETRAAASRNGMPYADWLLNQHGVLENDFKKFWVSVDFNKIKNIVLSNKKLYDLYK